MDKGFVSPAPPRTRPCPHAAPLPPGAAGRLLISADGASPPPPHRRDHHKGVALQRQHPQAHGREDAAHPAAEGARAAASWIGARPVEKQRCWCKRDGSRGALRVRQGEGRCEGGAGGPGQRGTAVELERAEPLPRTGRPPPRSKREGHDAERAAVRAAERVPQHLVGAAARAMGHRVGSEALGALARTRERAAFSALRPLGNCWSLRAPRLPPGGGALESLPHGLGCTAPRRHLLEAVRHLILVVGAARPGRGLARGPRGKVHEIGAGERAAPAAARQGVGVEEVDLARGLGRQHGAVIVGRQPRARGRAAWRAATAGQSSTALCCKMRRASV
jgi:hypothetical protein